MDQGLPQTEINEILISIGIFRKSIIVVIEEALV
jgi:hypothetical protein